MRYYCKKCGCEIKTGINGEIFGYSCPNPNCDETQGMKLIPDYETPEQYEKRTGNACLDNVLAFFRWLYDDGYGKWAFGLYKGVIEDDRYTKQVVIADPPVPPPNDWKPEEII